MPKAVPGRTTRNASVRSTAVKRNPVKTAIAKHLTFGTASCYLSFIFKFGSVVTCYRAQLLPVLHVGKTLSLLAQQSSFDRGSEASTLKSVDKGIDCRVQTSQHHTPSIQGGAVHGVGNVKCQDVENQIRQPTN